jgi:hypothetical protein
MLSHPIEHLKMRDLDLDTTKWDFDKQPPMFLAQGNTETLYMPFLLRIGIESLGEMTTLENGQSAYCYWLTEAVDANWQSFFKKYYPHENVTFEATKLILHCTRKDRKRFEHIMSSHAIHAATNDYAAERRILVWQVFERMVKQKHREHWESHILAVREEYHQGRQAEVIRAKETGSVVGGAILNFNWKFRQTLEVKFGWWQHVLDAPTIQKYRNLFEQDFRCA